MGFSRQEYWSGLPFPSPGDLPDPAIKPRSPALQADSLPFEPPDYLVGPILITGVFKDCQKEISQQKKGQRDMSLLSLKMDKRTMSQEIQVFFKKLKRRKQIIPYSL